MSTKKGNVPVLWKDMIRPVSLEDYSNQIRQRMEDAPVQLSPGLADPPRDKLYATFDPNLLQDRYRSRTFMPSREEMEWAKANQRDLPSPDAPDEILSYVVRSADGKLEVVTPVQKLSNLRDRHLNPVSNNVEAPIPTGARLATHNHVHRQAQGFVDKPESNDGYGDAYSLSRSNPIPTLTIARPTKGPFEGEDVIGVYKMVNGQLIFEAPYGAISDEVERKSIQNNLDRAQRRFYRN